MLCSIPYAAVCAASVSLNMRLRVLVGKCASEVREERGGGGGECGVVGGLLDCVPGSLRCSILCFMREHLSA